MRRAVAGLLVTLVLLSPAAAQDEPVRNSITPEQRDLVSDKRADEIKAQIRQAKKRQDDIARHNTDLWLRWTYAVCVGCGPVPKRLRIVHTNPLRVLAGVPAALDDARQRRGLSI